MTNINNTVLALFLKYDAMARVKYPAYASKPVPKLSLYIKGRTAGTACKSKWEVRINTHVGAQNLEMLDDTVSHEIAHMVDFAIRGKTGHDRLWKIIHRSLGGNGKRCYNAAEENVSIIKGRVTNEYLYRNPTNGHEYWFGPRYHNGLQRGKYIYLSHSVTGTRFYRVDYTGQTRKKA